MGSDEDPASADGFDAQIQTNYLSHALLTRKLIPVLERREGARIISHSCAHKTNPRFPLSEEYFEVSVSFARNN